MAHFDLPLRNRKGLTRAAQLRNFINPNPPDLDEPFFPPLNYAMWRRGPERSNGSSSMMHNPYYKPLSQAIPLPKPNSPFNIEIDPTTYFTSPYSRQSNSYTDRHNHSHNNSNSSKPRVSFAKAARSLHEALCNAERFTHATQHNFIHDTSFMRQYVDEPTLAYLWKRLANWDGIPLCDDDAEHTPNSNPNDPTAPPPDTPTFNTHARHVLSAIEDWSQAPQPSSQEWSALRSKGSVLREEDVRLAWRKLRVGCGAVEELLQGVREDRRRCDALLRELMGAKLALEGIREVWEEKGMGMGKEGREEFVG